MECYRACGFIITYPRRSFFSSITKQSKALSILVIIVMCLAITSAAPNGITSGQHQEAIRFHRHHRLSARSASAMLITDLSQPPWWHNPCRIKLINPPPPKRHSRLKNIKNLRLQIKDANRKYKTDIKKAIDKLYENLKPDKINQPNWLPKNQYRAFIRDLGTQGMNKQNITKKKLPQLYTRLQTFALTFDNLETVHIRSDSSSFDFEKRIHIIRDVKYQIRGILCELETALNSTDIKIPKEVKRKSYEGMEGWIESPDLTELSMLDMSIFNTYENFINDWNKIMIKIGKLPRTDGNVVYANKTTHTPIRNHQKSINWNENGERRRRRYRNKENLHQKV